MTADLPLICLSPEWNAICILFVDMTFSSGLHFSFSSDPLNVIALERIQVIGGETTMCQIWFLDHEFEMFGLNSPKCEVTLCDNYNKHFMPRRGRHFKCCTQ